MGYPVHPLAAEYPVMAGDQRKYFFEHVALHGQQEAIVLLDAQVLDGRHRQEAMEASGQEPRYRQFGSDPEDGDDPAAFVYRKNFHRRDLGYTDRQRLKRINDKRIMELRASGKSVRAIAKETGTSKAGVQRALEDQVYRGGTPESVPVESPDSTGTVSPEKDQVYRAGTPEIQSPEPVQEITVPDELTALDRPTVPAATPVPIPEPVPEPPKRVKGRDGKSYPASKYKKATPDPVEAWRKKLAVVVAEAPKGVNVLAEVKFILGDSRADALLAGVVLVSGADGDPSR